MDINTAQVYFQPQEYPLSPFYSYTFLQLLLKPPHVTSGSQYFFSSFLQFFPSFGCINGITKRITFCTWHFPLNFVHFFSVYIFFGFGCLNIYFSIFQFIDYFLFFFPFWLNLSAEFIFQLLHFTLQKFPFDYLCLLFLYWRFLLIC